MGGLLLPAEVIDDVPVIENDVSYTRNAHRNDDEWIIIQDMPNPSHDLRTKARHFVNDDASKNRNDGSFEQTLKSLCFCCYKQANWQIEVNV
jgi:hypothetical protein